MKFQKASLIILLFNSIFMFCQPVLGDVNALKNGDTIANANEGFSETSFFPSSNSNALDLLKKDKEFYQNQNKKLLNSINKFEQQNYELLIFGFCAIGFLVFAILFWLGIRFRHNKQIVLRNSKLEAEKLGFIEEISVLSTRNSELTEINVFKKRELTALTMQLASIQDTISGLIDKAASESTENKDSNIHSLTKEIRSLLSQKDYWNEFMIKFSQIHPAFNANIKMQFPNLTAKDISFCSLIKLNLSNKEIANLLQVSHESVITKKYLLKKKLALTSEQDLFQIINNIQ